MKVYCGKCGVSTCMSRTAYLSIEIDEDGIPYTHWDCVDMKGPIYGNIFCLMEEIDFGRTSTLAIRTLEEKYIK